MKETTKPKAKATQISESEVALRVKAMEFALMENNWGQQKQSTTKRAEEILKFLQGK